MAIRESEREEFEWKTERKDWKWVWKRGKGSLEKEKLCKLKKKVMEEGKQDRKGKRVR